MLWKHFRFVRNPQLIKSRLFTNIMRPDRLSLVGMNILKGVRPHQITSGLYVNGPGQQSLHSAQSRVAWQLREQRIGRSLKFRADPQDLQDRNVAPNIMSSSQSRVSNALVSRVGSLRRALSHASLTRQLNRRMTIHDIKHAGVLKNTTIAPSLVATQVELEKAMAGQKLDLKMSTRQTVHALRNKNVFNGDEDNEQIITSANSMDDIYTDMKGKIWSKDELLKSYHRVTKGGIIETRISTRPTVSDMDRGKMLDVRTTAIMICPSVRPKIRLYEGAEKQR